MEQKEEKKSFLTTDEAAEYLSLSKSTLYGYTSANIIPYYKPRGRRNYFTKEDLDAFILHEKHRIKSQKEVEAEAEKKIVKSKRRAERDER